MTEQERMSERQLKDQIEAIIEDRQMSGDPVPMSWVITATINKLGDPLANPFHQLTAAIGVHYLVRKVLQYRKKQETGAEPEQEDLFPGYTRLQRSYTIERNGEQVLVHLEHMTLEEGKTKAKELRSFAAGAMRHADEMDDYFSTRSQEQSG
jgi:hypothetical protein